MSLQKTRSTLFKSLLPMKWCGPKQATWQLRFSARQAHPSASKRSFATRDLSGAGDLSLERVRGVYEEPGPND